jgi:hypothetical protein
MKRTIIDFAVTVTVNIHCLSFTIISHHLLSVIHQTDGFLKVIVFWVCCSVSSVHHLNGSLVPHFRAMQSWTAWPWIPWHCILKCLNCSPNSTGSHQRGLESSVTDNLKCASTVRHESM